MCKGSMKIGSSYLISAKSHILQSVLSVSWSSSSPPMLTFQENDRGPIFPSALSIISGARRLPQAALDAQLLSPTAPQGLGIISVIIAFPVTETLVPSLTCTLPDLNEPDTEVLLCYFNGQRCHRTIRTRLIFTEST